MGLAKVAFGGELGIEADLAAVPAEGVERDDVLLFSESNSRYIITVPPDRRSAFEDALAGVPFACIGRVSEEPRLRLRGLSGETVVDADVLELKQRWKATLDGI